MQKSKVTFGALLSIVVIGLLFFGGTKKSEEKISIPENRGNIITSTPTPVPVVEIAPVVSQVKKSINPITLLDTKIPYNIQSRAEYPDIGNCQPESFDPEKNTIADAQSYFGKETISLDDGYELIKYQFGCASTQSFVLEIKGKDGSRYALYQNVSTWRVSPDNKFLFLSGYVKNRKGKFSSIPRIIDISKKEEVELPNMGCASQFSFWNGENLWTYTDQNSFEFGAYDFPTEFCEWSRDGKLLHRLEANLYWGAASAYYLNDQVGFLPQDSNIFYAYSNTIEHERVSDTEAVCYLYLQDITNQNRGRKIKMMNGMNGYCSRLTFDFTGFNFDSEKPSYVLEQN